MIRAVIDFHKKRFKRNPIVITVMMLYSLNYLIDRCISFYSVYPLLGDLCVETLLYYGLSFHFVPAFFNPLFFQKNANATESADEDSLLSKTVYRGQADDGMSFSSSSSMSSGEQYNPNRYDVSSPLHNSTLGRPF